MVRKDAGDPSISPLRRWRGWLVVIPGAYAVSFVASLLYGAPARLPGIALGFPVLLHLERAAAVLGVLAAVSTFAYMTSLGHLPNQFGNIIGYPGAGQQHDIESVAAEHDRKVDRRLIALEQFRRADDDALAVIALQLATLWRRIDDVETKRSV